MRYSDTKGSLSFYSKDEVFDYSNDIVYSNDFRLFKYKGKLLKNTFTDAANTILKDASIAVPLKYLSNFWGSLEMLLINCRVESLFYQRKRIKNYQNSLAKDLKDQCIGINNDFNDFRKIKERRLKNSDRNVTVL